MTKKVIAIFLALLYSIILVVVGPMVETQSFTFSAVQILRFLLCFVCCCVINLLVFSVVPRYRFDIKNERLLQYLKKLGDNKLFFLVWAFIFVSWIPAYLILYPGVLSYDMISQVGSAMSKIDMNHHPVLHTWLIRFFMKLGKNLLGEYEHGLGLLSLLQMLILSYALARLVMLLKKKGVGLLVVALTALFSAIWFMNACLSVTMIKDTLHAAFLVLFVCHFTEIVTNPFDYISKKRNYVLFPIISFLMCAFRNNGIHIYVFCFAILCILRISQIKNIKRYVVLVTVILLPICMHKVYTGPVFDAFGIRQGEVREALSIPIQQLQRVAVKRAAELTSEQTERMGYYIDDLEWRDWDPGREYDPFISDPAKSCFYSAHYNEDPIAFWKFYVKIGMQFSKEYVEAFLSNTLGYWYPGYYEYSYVMYDNYSPEVFAVPLERKSIQGLSGLKKFYESVCLDDFWRSTPVLRIFFVSGFTIWLLLYGLLLAWRKRGYFTRILPLFLPLIAQYGIMILSPMSSFRYSWPIYLMLPFAFVGIWGNKELSIMEEKDVEAHPAD